MVINNALNKNRPFLKWAGGKFKLLDELKKHLPNGKRYIEPFLGAGAVALNVDDYPQHIVADTNCDLISLWLSLNRHCFNGLCRYNSDGKFNVPLGKYKTFYFPEKELYSCVEKIKHWDIQCSDFRSIFKLVRAGDVVYCDPPYIPLSDSSHFVNY